MHNAMLPNDFAVRNVSNIVQVPFIDLKRQYISLKDQILETIDNILSSGNYILGEVVESFEAKVANYLGCRYVLGVANGTDAIILALKALNIGVDDEVILPVNSFVATAGAVAAIGAIPVLCDVNEDLNIDVSKIESLITQHTKAIIPVHLTGRSAQMDSIMEIANRHALYVVEDAAQSIGATYRGKMTGTIGDIGCFSLHPLKNLHVYGDGGLISTNNEDLYQAMKLLRNHGLANRDTCLQWGLNSRLDALQAAMGLVSLTYLDAWNKKRCDNAQKYCQRLQHTVTVPQDKLDEYAVYHNFVILTEKRDELMAFLLSKGIETKIHYPIPIHLQPAASKLGYKKGDFPIAEKLSQHMLSLPIYSDLSEIEINTVIDNILDYFTVKK